MIAGKKSGSWRESEYKIKFLMLTVEDNIGCQRYRVVMPKNSCSDIFLVTHMTLTGWNNFRIKIERDEVYWARNLVRHCAMPPVTASAEVTSSQSLVPMPLVTTPLGP